MGNAGFPGYLHRHRNKTTTIHSTYLRVAPHRYTLFFDTFQTCSMTSILKLTLLPSLTPPVQPVQLGLSVSTLQTCSELNPNCQGTRRIYFVPPLHSKTLQPFLSSDNLSQGGIVGRRMQMRLSLSWVFSCSSAPRLTGAHLPSHLCTHRPKHLTSPFLISM